MKRIILTLTIIISIVFVGCNSKKEESTKKELLLYCGAGIRPPVDEMIEVFAGLHNVKIVPDYAGSEVLLSKIKITHLGDLYMPGDRHYVDQADAADMILSRQAVCRWGPTILVQKGNPKKISELRDLLKPNLKLGFGDPNACAIGRTTRKLLAKNNITWKDIRKNVLFQSLTVNELGMQIQARSLDAVIVWGPMARYYSRHGEMIAIADANNIISTVDIGVLKFTKNKELAEKFVAFLISQQGREIFEKYNYRTDLPK